MPRITGNATDTATLKPTIGKNTLRIDLDTLDPNTTHVFVFNASMGTLTKKEQYTEHLDGMLMWNNEKDTIVAIGTRSSSL